MSEYSKKREELTKITKELLVGLKFLNGKAEEYRRLSTELMRTEKTVSEQRDLDDYVREDEDCIKALRLLTALDYVENPEDKEILERLLTDIYISGMDDEELGGTREL